MARQVPRIPSFIYGTAWKEENTADLVKRALAAGFDAIDTANQKKHYREDFAGDALKELKVEGLERGSLFIQSKYTYERGQDHRLPYDPKDSFSDQVKSSFQSSLRNLGTNYLDSFLLHGPLTNFGLTDVDWEVWETFEDLCRSGKARKIGVSNFSFEQLEELFEKSLIKPMFVQNRCFASRGWDQRVREYCLENEIVYQGFSLLTANPEVLNSDLVADIATKHGATPQQIIFSFSRSIGILPLTGTSNPENMASDLKAFDFELSSKEIDAIFNLSK